MPAKPFLPVGEFQRVQIILNRYLENAEKSGKTEAIADIKHLMKCFNKCYPAYHKKIMEDGE